MTQYAAYDSTASQPTPVLGWYDTAVVQYPNLPGSDSLLELTSDQWTARLPGPWAVQNGALVAYTPPVPLPQQAANLLATNISLGIAITCTGNAGLNSTYGLDSITMSQIGSVAQDFASGLGLPGGLSTFTYPDMSSDPMTFTGAQIVELYKAQRNLIFVMTTQSAIMANGGSPTWPTQSATIA